MRGEGGSGSACGLGVREGRGVGVGRVCLRSNGFERHARCVPRVGILGSGQLTQTGGFSRFGIGRVRVLHMVCSWMCATHTGGMVGRCGARGMGWESGAGVRNRASTRGLGFG